MTTATASRSVASGPTTQLDQELASNGALWFRDPTGETAVRNLLNSAPDDDFELIDGRGNTVFRIKCTHLAALLPELTFSLTRRGRQTIRAHKKNVPAAGGHQREDEDRNTLPKGIKS